VADPILRVEREAAGRVVRPAAGRKGRDDVLANFAQIPNYWSSFSVEPSEFIEAGDKVIVSGTQRATGKGGSFEAPFLHLMEYRDGKVVRGEFEGDSAKALKALG